MVCSGVMLSGIILLLIGLFVDMGQYIVFIAEEFLLIPAGFAVIVKSGVVLRDRLREIEATAREKNNM